MTPDTHTNPKGKRGRRATSSRPFWAFAFLVSALMGLATAQDPPPSEPPEAPAEAPAPTDSKDPPLPKLEEMQTPTAAELLHGRPVDWIVLKTYDVIVAEPVYPRPHTLEKMQAKIDAHNDKLKNVPVNQVDQWRAEREKLNYLRLTLPGEGEQPEYQLHIRFIREIIHHEDLMLRRVNESLDNRDLRGAFELILRLERRYPDWPGVEEARNRLVFLEAEKRAEAGDWEQAFVFLEKLHQRRPDFPDLSSRLGQAADRLIAAAVESDDYRRARHFLNRLVQREPQHQIAGKWQADLLSRAEELLRQSRAALDDKRYDAAVTLADKAARVWPATPVLAAGHQRAARRFQRLDVGVVRLPGEATVYPLPTEADLRQRRLTELPLFELDSFDESAHYRSRHFEEWEPTDLGRRVAFTLRQSISPWESQRPLSAIVLAESLRARLDPASPLYDARLDNHLDSMTITSPLEFEIGFAQVPLRVESLFAFPIAGPARRVAGAKADRPPGSQAPGHASLSPGHPPKVPLGERDLLERFRVHDRSDRHISYRRSVPEPDGLSQYHIAEVVERRYDSYQHSVQALLRGDVSMLPRVDRRDVHPLRRDGRFFVQQFALPTTYILQFHPASRPLRHRELRRALAYAIDRRQILRRILVPAGSEADTSMERAEQQGWARITTAAWPQQHKGYDALVEPHPHDAVLAASLALAARKQLGGELRPLKLVCPPDVEARAVAEDLARQWAAVGIQVELVPDGEAESGEEPEVRSQKSRNQEPDSVQSDSQPDGTPPWDILYRTVQMADPHAELWPLLTLQPSTRVESLAWLPDWLRQELIRLEQARDWNTSEALLRDLHRHLHEELQLIPLWETDEFLTVRKNVHGLPERPLHPWQNIERWVADPWYPRETP